MPTTSTTEELITSIYNGLYLRDPDATEIVYWTEQLDVGVVAPVGLVLQIVTETEFTETTLPIAMTFEAVFGRYADMDELMIWKTVYDHGLTLNEMGQLFVLSREFSDNNSALDSTTAYLQALAETGLGREANQAELDTYVPMIDAGEINYGDIVQLIVDNNGRGVNVGFAMLYGGLNGVVPTASEIDPLGVSQEVSLDGTIPYAVNQLIKESPFFTSASGGDLLSLVENSGNLLVSGELTADMEINLADMTVVVDTLNHPLSEGSLSSVITVDAGTLTGKGHISFVGRSFSESYTASTAGDTIRGAGGDDQLTGGTGLDRFIFEADATANGLDLINNFQLSTPDVLDFSAFLKITGTSSIALVDATSTAEVPWANGDVLVVEGYDLTSGQAIADLFGPGASFAAPTTRAKAVVLVTDIVGDASVWYLVNQVTTTSIEAEELTEVAVLGGINNLGLISFTADNFA